MDPTTESLSQDCSLRILNISRWIRIQREATVKDYSHLLVRINLNHPFALVVMLPSVSASVLFRASFRHAMEFHHHKGKLTGVRSSLLRSPTLRSSVHIITFTVGASDIVAAGDDDDEKKLRHGRCYHRRRRRNGHLLLLLFLLSMLLLLGLIFLYLREESLLFANIVLCSALISLASVVACRSSLCRSSLAPKRDSSVDWFIGDDARKPYSRQEFEEKKKYNRKGLSPSSPFVCEGVEFYSNGDFYEGEFHRGRCSGSGVYNFYAKGRYEGDWVDGKYNGYGVESWARGSRYRGQYRQGLRHGFGVYKFYSDDSYAGEWAAGQSHGVGLQTCSDGSCYIGEFKCGVKHGLGYYHFRNGDRYSGEYFGDKIHGFGVYHFANGHRYEGSWHEGKKQGFGMYIFRNGNTRSGEWDHGALKTSLLPSDPAVQRAVQVAHKCRENSVLVPRVDDQVNRTIAAANRAATAARVAAIKAVQNKIDGKFCNTDV